MSSDLLITTLLIVALFVLLGSGVWIGLALAGVAWIGMELFSSRPAGDAMAVTIWGTASSWTLTALPLFVWDGRDPVPDAAVRRHVQGPRTVARAVARPPAAYQYHRLHDLRRGVGIFRRNLRHDRQDDTAGAQEPGLPRRHHDRHTRRRRNLGPADPAVDHHDRLRRVRQRVDCAAVHRRRDPRASPCGALLGLHRRLGAPSPGENSGRLGTNHDRAEALCCAAPIPSSIDALVLGSIYAGIATATEAAAFGVVGALAISSVQGSLTWTTFRDSLLGATRLYCMIALILAGAAFLTLAMGYIGLPRHLAEWIGGLGLSQLWLIVAMMVFYIILGCFLDGISMVVLTMGVILPTIAKAGIDLLWFGIFIVLVVEMAQITPPVGFNLFVLQGMTKKQITWIAKQALPMLCLMIVATLLIYVFPQLVTFLPQQMKIG
jgi:TRAP-type mannitol/chloroaromatic compound transport system permease large subunit